MTAVAPEAFAAALASYLRAWDAAHAEGVPGEARTGVALRVALGELGVTVEEPPKVASAPSLEASRRFEVAADSRVSTWRVLDHSRRVASIPMARLDALTLRDRLIRDPYRMFYATPDSSIYERLARP